MSSYNRALVLVLGTFVAGCGGEAPATSRSPAPAATSRIDDRASTVVAAAAANHSPLRFTDIARAAGLTVPHFEAADGRFRLVETMGSGVALIDYDGDGWLDIFLPQGCLLPVELDQGIHTAKLYRNNRDGSFDDVTSAAGVAFHGYGQGVAVGDFDGDGHDDLYISAFGGGVLYRNNGDGTFRDVTMAAGLNPTGWETSSAFADLDGDGDLDLFVVHYLADTVAPDGRPTATCNAVPGQIGYCPPNVFTAEPDALYRNNGDGTFTDVSVAAGITTVAGNGLGLAIVDFDGDGRLDIFVANDQSPNALWRNRGNLRFEEGALAWGLAYNESGDVRAGMGVAVGDYDEDGRIDLLVTNFYEEASTLYRNAAPGRFQVATQQARLAVPSRSKLGFGAGFADFDNDGRLDLFVANGHINDVRPLRMPYRMTPQVFRNQGQGKFTDESAAAGPYFQATWLGRGAAFGDLDNDGDTDIVVTHLGQPPAVLRNDSDPRGHFLSVLLIAAGKSSSPVGAAVTAHIGNLTITRTVAAGTSYLSANDRRIILGLGASARVDRLEIRWPSGRMQEVRDLAADRFVTIVEGSSPQAQKIAPRP